MEITKDTLFKLTNEGGAPSNGGRSAFRWPVPTQNDDGTWTPGAWTRAYKTVIPCSRGYHLARLQDLTLWQGTHLWVAEHDDEAPVVHDDSKVVVRRARLLAPVSAWGDRMLRLFAADCAERVLPIYEREVPGENRPRIAIEIARKFARGECTADDLAAAWDAASAAARDAEREWQNARLLQYLTGGAE